MRFGRQLLILASIYLGIILDLSWTQKVTDLLFWGHLFVQRHPMVSLVITMLVWFYTAMAILLNNQRRYR